MVSMMGTQHPLGYAAPRGGSDGLFRSFVGIAVGVGGEWANGEHDGHATPARHVGGGPLAVGVGPSTYLTPSW